MANDAVTNGYVRTSSNLPVRPHSLDKVKPSSFLTYAVVIQRLSPLTAEIIVDRRPVRLTSAAIVI